MAKPRPRRKTPRGGPSAGTYVDALTFSAVLAAALMHASWNAMVRAGGDRFVSILGMSLGSAVISAPLVLVFPLPAAAAWPWLALSVAFHTGYKLSLIKAYETGDLSQVYPLARGSAPVLVAVISVTALAEPLSVGDMAAIGMVGFGVILMSTGGTSLNRLSGAALGFALATALCTAGYTLTDGVGARAAAHASAYAVWLFLFDGIVMAGCAAGLRGRAAFAPLRVDWRTALLAGGLSLGSYWVAIWAFTRAPIAMVGALRETSVLFAMLIAALILREPVGPRRWAAGALIAVGVIGLRL